MQFSVSVESLLLFVGQSADFPDLLRNVSSSFNRSKERGFAELFSVFGMSPHVKDCTGIDQDQAEPFSQFENTTAVPKLVASAYGKVLELGPAVGSQLSRLDPARLDRVYGIEPNENFLPQLEEKIKKLDLTGVYTPIIGRVEDEELLRKHGVVVESLDCVLSIQVLCSVSDPPSVARLLYKLLKPGGQIVLWEHQASRDEVTRWVQRMYNLVWTPTIGGCRLTSEVEAALLTAGDWQTIELERSEQPWQLMPRVWGRLVK